MKTSERVNPSRVMTDASYAETLSTDDWVKLAGNPLWLDLVADEPELMEQVRQRIEGPAATPRTKPPSNPSLAKTNLSIVNTSKIRIHGPGVVGTTGSYLQNTPPVPNMLYMKTLRSPHPHAKIKAIDSKAAEALPGVAAVLHQFNLPKEYKEATIGSGPPVRYLFGEEIFQVGAPVACVAASDEHVADEAIRLIEVQYEVLPSVTDFLEGMSAQTPKQWDSKLNGTILANVTPFKRGDGNTALSTAEVVAETVTSHPYQQHVALELSNCLSYWDNGQLIMHRATRHPHADRRSLAQALGLQEHQVRVIQSGYMGSSYGSQRSIENADEIHTAILSLITGRPVRHMATRYEDFINRSGRAQEQTTSKIGVKRDGTIVAAHFTTIGNAGALRSGVATGGWVGFQNLYKIPHMTLDGTDVLTNSYRNGTLRCVSHPNATLAQEITLDKAAYAIGMNPLDIRLKNLNADGNPESKRPYNNYGMREVLTKVAEAIGWQAKWHAPKAKEVRPGVFHGIGLAAHTCSHGAGGAPSTASIVVNPGSGMVDIVSAATEVGSGQRTTMAMICAEALGIPYEMINISPGVDTAYTADTGNTAGSRQTLSGGWGVYEAAIDARTQILAGAAKKFVADAKAKNQTISVAPEDLDIVNAEVISKKDAALKMKFGDAVASVVSGSPVLGRGVHIHEPDWERLAFAAHAAEVEVDTGTGTVTILKYVAGHDVGRAINIQGIEQQIEGGTIMGIGHALTEDLMVDKSTGLPINGNILDYKILSIKDVPRKIDMVIVEKPKDYGIFGAHGIGEPPTAVPMPTIANAVYNAIGVWIGDMPITRVKVLNALRSA